MKDPLDSKQRAYEVLGLPRTASRDEINAAYASLTKQYPARRQEVTNAWQKLRRPETRLEEDFWYYMVGDGNSQQQNTPTADEPLVCDPVAPPLDVGIEVTDLADNRWKHVVPPREFRDLKLSHIERYDEPVKQLPVTFDK
jgi:hypothetical protein